MNTLRVPLAERSYDVLIGRLDADTVADALVKALGKHSGLAVLIDAHVATVSPRCSALLAALSARLPRVQTYRLPRGESSKNLAAVEQTTEWLSRAGFDRGCAILGIGGGAATDHAGFVASIYLRGVRFALCPTTLLAMVDASVGGKTAVDIPAGKNLVGAFHQPVGVVADLGTLETLPAREVSAGLAEIVKAGLIADPTLFAKLETQENVATGAALAEVVAASVKVKIDVVSEDERESGRRAILNFGHTLGHAIEAASGYALLHGEAVSLGMVAALALGEARGVTEPGLGQRVRRLLSRLGLPVDYETRLSSEVLGLLEADKKRRGQSVRFVLVPAIGRAELVDIPFEELKNQLLILATPGQV